MLNDYEKYNDDFIFELLSCINTFCRDDDITEASTDAYKNALHLGDAHKLHVTCYSLLKTRSGSEKLLPILCISVGVMANNEEFCKDLNKEDDTGVITILLNIIKNNISNKIVVNNCLSSLVKLVRSDDNKKIACSNPEFYGLLVHILDNYNNNNSILCNVLQLVAGVTLRQVDHVHQIMEAGLGTRVVNILITHTENKRVLKYVFLFNIIIDMYCIKKSCC